MIKVVSRSPEQTRALASKFAKSLKGGEVLALEGNLGSGKTTFVKGLGQGLGIKEKVRSPSFLLVRPYLLPRKNRVLYHFDLYRIGKTQDLQELGFADILNDPRNIVAIEWGRRAGKLPRQAIDIKFAQGQALTERIITIK